MKIAIKICKLNLKMKRVFLIEEALRKIENNEESMCIFFLNYSITIGIGIEN